MRLGHGSWLIALGVVAACTSEESSSDEAAVDAAAADTVVMETTLGRIVIELDNERAPVSVENFLLHVRSGFYDGVVFHRIESGFVAQAGEVDSEGRKRISPVFPIENEAANGLHNLRGTVAMARGGDPHSATSQFFFNLVDNAKLDYTASTATGWGYAVFGRMIEGLDVMDSIARLPTVRRRTYPHFPTEPPVITRAHITTEQH